MPRAAIDLAGRHFGRLTAIHRVPSTGKFARWLCRCDCGNAHIARSTHLTSGNIQSCGCLRLEVMRSQASVASLSHGHAASGTQTGTYSSWAAMFQRCENPRSRAYKYYGGRGIIVCERWKSFENFLFDMGERPVGKSIDRINNDGNYEPGNCRWATQSEQLLNRRPRSKKAA